MLALIYENAYYHSLSSNHQKASIINALEKRDIKYLILDRIEDFYKVQPQADFCIFLDKDNLAAAAIEQAGIKVYNNSSAILGADSKITASIKCSSILDMPNSIFSPFRYTYAPLRTDFLHYVQTQIKYPLVLKADKSSLGKDVHLVHSAEDLVALDKQYWEKRYILQQYIKESSGKSIRVIVIDSEVICSIGYINAADFRSNREQGGEARVHNASPDFCNAAVAVAKAMDAFYCGVDFFFLEQPCLIEVNGNAYFRGAEECCNINIADILIEKILHDINLGDKT